MEFPVEHIVFDFEVMKHDWGVVFFNINENTYTRITNNRQELIDYYQAHSNSLFIGFNVVGYDMWIMKTIMLGNDPMKLSNFIINQKRKDKWNLAGCEKIYQSYPINVFDVKSGSVKQSNMALSLKEAEANMGEAIVECDIPWDIDRKLTSEELDNVMNYCENDVKMTTKIFQHPIVQMDLRTKEDLIKLTMENTTVPFTLNQGYRETNPRLIARLMNAHKALPTNMRKGFPLTFPQSIKHSIPEKIWTIVNDIWNEKYWGMQHQLWCKFPSKTTNCCVKNYSFKKVSITIANVPSTFGVGGLHGALPKYRKPKDKKLMIIDAASFYPHLMMFYGLFSRAAQTPLIYNQIFKMRFAAKKIKDPIEAAYKLVLNSTYGVSGNQYSKLYDPQNSLNVPVLGQLLLLNLIDRFKHLKNVKMIQYNTDGIIIEYNDSDIDSIMKITKAWETATGIPMTYEHIEELIQKDVNNYIMLGTDGKLKTKGTFVKQYGKTNFIKNHMAIIHHGIVDSVLYGKSVEEIVENAPLEMFSFIAKHTGKYDGMAMRTLTGETVMVQQRNRVFAVDPNKYDTSKIGTLYKLKKINIKTTDKNGKTILTPSVSHSLVPSCPPNAAVFNEKLTPELKKYIFSILDKGWYIASIIKVLKGW